MGRSPRCGACQEKYRRWLPQNWAGVGKTCSIRGCGLKIGSCCQVTEGDTLRCWITTDDEELRKGKRDIKVTCEAEPTNLSRANHPRLTQGESRVHPGMNNFNSAATHMVN